MEMPLGIKELDKDKSVVASPLSAEYVLAILALGSTNEVHSELLDSLGFLDDDSGVTLNVANKVYIMDGDYELNPQLKEDAEKVFDAGIEKLDFSDGAYCANLINKWVESKTNERIKDLLSEDSLNSLTRLVLVNALYFKIGLELNFSKCELFIPDSNPSHRKIIDLFEKAAPSIKTVDKSSLRLQGSPILDESLPGFIDEKIENFRAISDRLLKINIHVAFVILRFCLFVPKFTYFLRCSQLWKHPSLTQPLDDIMRDTLISIFNTPLDDRAWRQASLPIRMGGLGGTWKKQFDPLNTRPHPFHVNENKQIDVPMMYKEDTYAYVAAAAVRGRGSEHGDRAAARGERSERRAGQAGRGTRPHGGNRQLAPAESASHHTQVQNRN
ncbi:Serpin-2 [Operophtera brumata]|uniref:Serpin-2 n=1 Tax=Operophtera brumata TaxID=104452 RepID=A0A0L7LQ40_OPEBR|nr:Serpin-2 [Operophtera brumata]